MITGVILALVLGSLLSSSEAVEMAKIMSKTASPSFTSSTLEWEDMTVDQTPPADALTVSPGGPLWCRAEHSNNWISGAVVDGHCSIPFLGRVYHMDSYSVLVSINGSARIMEAEWDRLQAIPDKGVLTPTMLLAVNHTSDGQIIPGYVSPNERRAYFLVDGKHQKAEKAFILTEEEPASYMLDQIIRNEETSEMKTEEKIIQSVTLRNEDDQPGEASKMVDYNHEEMLYWGRSRGTITGLNTRVVEPSGRKMDITWGIQNTLENVQQQEVTYMLPARAGVDAELVGIYHNYEAGYTGHLTSVYKDDERRSRLITGFHIHRYLAELKVNFNKPYFLGNNSAIEGDFETSRILVHSTTTTTTTTTVAPPPQDDKPQSDSLAASFSDEVTDPQSRDGNSAGANLAGLPTLVVLALLTRLLHH